MFVINNLLVNRINVNDCCWIKNVKFNVNSSYIFGFLNFYVVPFFLMSQIFKVWISECPSFWVKHYGSPKIIKWLLNVEQLEEWEFVRGNWGTQKKHIPVLICPPHLHLENYPVSFIYSIILISVCSIVITWHHWLHCNVNKTRHSEKH
jgi:hypothetical protein